MKQVVLIGDSIRLHYQPLVAAALKNRAQVWGPSENGGTSTNVLSHIEEWVLDRRPDIVHLNCGLHDLRYDGRATKPNVPIGVYADNLERMFAKLAAARCSVVWATTTPINEVRHQASRSSLRREADVARYNVVSWAIAERHGAAINDLNRAVRDGGADALLKGDGVHFTEDGYALLAKHVVAVLEQALAH